MSVRSSVAWRVVWGVWVVTAVMHPSVHAQTFSAGTLPVEYVEALLATSGNGMRLLPLEAAEALSEIVEWPDGTRVIAVVRTGAPSLQAVLEVPVSQDDAIRVFQQALEARGWRELPPVSRMLGGFRPPPGPRSASASRNFCGADEQALIVNVRDRQGRTIVRVELSQAPWLRQRCEPTSSPRERISERLPLLTTPEAASTGRVEFGSVGGIVGSGAHSRAELRSDLTPYDLAAHFGLQLSALGWWLDGEWLDEVSAGQVWRHQFDDGFQGVGALTVIQLEPGRSFVEFRLVRASP